MSSDTIKTLPVPELLLRVSLTRFKHVGVPDLMDSLKQRIQTVLHPVSESAVTIKGKPYKIRTFTHDGKAVTFHPKDIYGCAITHYVAGSAAYRTVAWKSADGVLQHHVTRPSVDSVARLVPQALRDLELVRDGQLVHLSASKIPHKAYETKIDVEVYKLDHWTYFDQKPATLQLLEWYVRECAKSERIPNPKQFKFLYKQVMGFWLRQPKGLDDPNDEFELPDGLSVEDV